MGGVDSDAFRTFEDLFLRGFMALQRHTEGLSAVVQVGKNIGVCVIANCSLLRSYSVEIRREAMQILSLHGVVKINNNQIIIYISTTGLCFLLKIWMY